MFKKWWTIASDAYARFLLSPPIAALLMILLVVIEFWHNHKSDTESMFA